MNQDQQIQSKRKDRLAAVLIQLVALSLLACLGLMVCYLVWMAVPLFRGSDHQKVETFLEDPPLYFGLGPYAERVFFVDEAGVARIVHIAGGKTGGELSLNREGRLLKVLPGGFDDEPGAIRLNLLAENGTLTLVKLFFNTIYPQNRAREVFFGYEGGPTLMLPEGLATETDPVLRWDGQGNTTLVCLLENGGVYYAHQKHGGTTQTQVLQANRQGRLTHVTVTNNGREVFAGTSIGELITWRVNSDGVVVGSGTGLGDGSPMTGLTLTFGERSLVTSHQNGQVTAWHVPAKTLVPTPIRHLKSHQTTVTRLIAAPRRKEVLTLDAGGRLLWQQLTTGKVLLDLGTELVDVAPADHDAGFVGYDAFDLFHLYSLTPGHPEVNMTTLFGPVQYEGYPHPTFTWQSGASNHHSEPKLSLIPLILGSLKGTFYGLLFAVPLALMTAVYVARVMDSRRRLWLKPMIELMAAVPSVVVGFLAALWLAPRLEHNLLPFFTALAVLPLLAVGCLFLVFRAGQSIAGREFWWCLPVLLLGCYLSWVLGRGAEQMFFQGQFNLWLYEELGHTVEQRNALVIGFALGFAVIPIIFTVAEEALYQVPLAMTTAAMALGSSRWQVIRRIVLPIAAPGLFAACMFGLSRAVGETMIVLMATGNTPVMTLGPFDGMRTLAANIAIEMPEAAQGSTLYRVLFLSALMLFVMTFIINTLADVVRNRLRQRYEGI